MAVTQNTYTGNGSTVLYSFTFPYLETTDIKVSVNGTNTTAYTLANATTVQFNTAPANGAAIRIYRETDDSSLQATFYPGSAIRSSDLNDNFTQNLYVTQEANNVSAAATTTANTALTNSNTAISTANSAVSTANTASSNASAAVSTANTASSNASAAVSTANTASTNASAAVSTANSAAANAATALSTANTALSTANTANTNASAAVSTANTASSNASAAVSTANTASSNASSAVTTANNAVTTANSAVSTANSATSTANTALSTANAAASAVANAILYDIVANVAAIPGSPANNKAVEVVDSTGIESFTPLANKPAGFTGSSGLSVRIVYTTTGNTWNWIQYFPNDPETRYLKFSGGTLTGQLRGDDSTSASTPGFAFDGDPNTGMGRPGADELALITGGTARLTIDSGGAVSIGNSLTVGGQTAVVTNDSRLTDTRTPADGSVTDAKVAVNAGIDKSKISGTAITAADTGTVTSTMIANGTIVDADISASAAISGSKVQSGTTTNAGVLQLTDSTSSTSTTTAATPNAVKSAYDLANAAVPKSLVDAKGDLLVASANDTVARLAVGSNNQVLTADSAASSGVKWATPAAGGSMVYISSVTASNSASVAFTSGIDSTYDVYVISFSGVESTGTGAGDLNMRFSTNGGSSYFSGASDYLVRLARSVTALILGTSQSAIKVTDQVNPTASNTPVGGFVYLHNASVSGKHTSALIYCAELDSPADNHGVGRSSGMGTGVVNAVQFTHSSANLYGTFRLYGIKNS